VDGIGSVPCEEAGSDFSGIGPLGSATRELVICHFTVVYILILLSRQIFLFK
jgi:hypothetical protein